MDSLVEDGRWTRESAAAFLPLLNDFYVDIRFAELMPFYGTGEIIAGEYVTRAYNTLYYAEHGYAAISLLLNEKMQGFSYIEAVYLWITVYEKPDILSEPLSQVYNQTEVGNIFDSRTGDVLYVKTAGENQPYLLIDLGETAFQGKTGYRSYFRSKQIIILT